MDGALHVSTLGYPVKSWMLKSDTPLIIRLLLDSSRMNVHLNGNLNMGKQARLKKQRKQERSIYYKDGKPFVRLEGKDAEVGLKSWVEGLSEDDFDDQGNLK
jgi:hypothetical protein